MYDISFLCKSANISQQTFYRLARENIEFKLLLESNRRKKSNGYYYNDNVLQWLCSYYNVPFPVSSADNEQKKEEDNSAYIVPLLNQIEELKIEIEALKAELAEKESERKQLFAANSNLLLLLSQEKAEKQLLLPKEPIKKTEPEQTEEDKPQSFIERLKFLFNRK